MAQSTKGRLNYRCPSCFMRDLDIDMFYDSEKQEFYCIRCQFFGTEEQVLKMNEMVRVRYKDMMKRFTDLVFCYPDARFEQMLLLMDKVADKRINYHIVINGELIIDN